MNKRRLLVWWPAHLRVAKAPQGWFFLGIVLLEIAFLGFPTGSHWFRYSRYVHTDSQYQTNGAATDGYRNCDNEAGVCCPSGVQPHPRRIFFGVKSFRRFRHTAMGKGFFSVQMSNSEFWVIQPPDVLSMNPFNFRSSHSCQSQHFMFGWDPLLIAPIILSDFLVSPLRFAMLSHIFPIIFPYFPIFSQYFLHIFPIFSHIFPIFSPYFPHIFPIFSPYFPHIFSIFSPYLPHIFPIFPHIFPYFPIFSQYFPHIFPIFSPYFPHICPIFAPYFPIFSPYFPNISSYFSIFFPYFPLVSPPFSPPFFAPGLCHGGGAAGWLRSLGALDLGAADPREGLVAQGRPCLGWDDLLWHYGNSWEYPRMMGIMDTIGLLMDYGLREMVNVYITMERSTIL